MTDEKGKYSTESTQSVVHLEFLAGLLHAAIICHVQCEDFVQYDLDLYFQE